MIKGKISQRRFIPGWKNAKVKVENASWVSKDCG